MKHYIAIITTYLNDEVKNVKFDAEDDWYAEKKAAEIAMTIEMSRFYSTVEVDDNGRTIKYLFM